MCPGDHALAPIRNLPDLAEADEHSGTGPCTAASPFFGSQTIPRRSATIQAPLRRPLDARFHRDGTVASGSISCSRYFCNHHNVLGQALPLSASVARSRRPIPRHNSTLATSSRAPSLRPSAASRRGLAGSWLAYPIRRWRSLAGLRQRLTSCVGLGWRSGSHSTVRLQPRID